MTWFTREQILQLMEALADVNADVHVRCWRVASDREEHLRGARGDWTGPYRYEMHARFPGPMTAEACVRLAEVVHQFGAEAVLWEHGEGDEFHIHPPGDMQFDEMGRQAGGER